MNYQKELNMRKLTTIAAAVSSALLVSYGTTALADITAFAPAAYAESKLSVTNFQILGVTGVTPGTAGFGTGGVNFDLGNTLAELAANGLTGIQTSVVSTISSSIKGVPGTPVPGSPQTIDPVGDPGSSISHSVAAGPNAANYVPYTSYLVNTLGAGTFSGAASDHSGNGLGFDDQPYTTATTHAQVNINGVAQGSADSRQNLSTEFILTLTTGQIFDVLFNASAFIRNALGQPDVNSLTNLAWNLTVENITDPDAEFVILDWQPQGTAGLGGSNACEAANFCAELADSFDLNQARTRLNTGDVANAYSGSFGVRAALGEGTYRFSIGHVTSADASAIPEPGSLMLVGAAMLGFAGIRRRAKKV
jgi:hypothetical protein